MSMQPRSRRAAVPLVLLALLVASPLPGQPRSLTILHTNDMHASFMPHEALWVRTSPKPMVGGFAELAFVADSLKRSAGPVLMLDAGDVMTGNPITERMYRNASGGALFDMMNMIGYDAWCPGNHDFDISQANLRALTAIARFPTLCANVVDDQGAYPVGNRPWVVLERGGLRIGVIGLMSQELYSLVNQNNLTGIRVLPPAATVQRFIDELDPKTDLLVALTHEGVQEDSVLATETTGLDIIVGGHSHTRLRTPKLVNGVIIVQTGSNAENLGALKITAENDRVTAYDGQLIPLWAQGKRPPSALTALADSFQAEIDKEYSEVIATLAEGWHRADGQSGVGTFIAEAQRTAAGADVAFMNNYGIRRDVPAGPLTKKALFEVLPFRNILTTFQLSGRELRAVMVYNIEKKPAIQIAGMSGRWKSGPGGKPEFLSIMVGGKPLDDAAMYRCAASDYFVGEARRYLGVEVRQPVFLQQTVFAAIEKAVRAAGTLAAPVLYAIERAD
jgi:2',3'-cyclic-nucleotide 2'-phosphodiesterase (5'-nucleotidase family)